MEKDYSKTIIYHGVISGFHGDFIVVNVIVGDRSITQYFRKELLIHYNLTSIGDEFKWYSNDEGQILKENIMPVKKSEKPKSRHPIRLESILESKEIVN